MLLIGFKAYRRGFVGCLADGRAYVYFVFSRGAFKPVQSYPRAQFENTAHFVTSLHKFVPLRFFLRRPIRLPSLENSLLQSVGRSLAGTLTAEAYLSLRHNETGTPIGCQAHGGPSPDGRACSEG